jgi:alanine transaminase
LNQLTSHYYLDENNGWSIDSNSIDVALKKAEADGTTIRAIVVINPGNPTGQVLSSDALKDIITYCKDKNICVIADDVYQENVYKEGKKFTSFRKVAYEMNAFDGTNPLQLVSLHSTSKGFFGECGLRGGYFELLGFSQEVRDTVYKLASLTLCSNTIGQIATGVMVNPPKQGDPSYDTYTTERSAILESLQRRATKLSHALDQLEGVSCNSADGAMYCFPSIVLPEGAHIAAKERGCAVDEMYCFELLEATGIITVAGTGFSQVPGTFHVRFTILPPEDQIATLIDSITTFHASFLKKYH